ncbi:hypothetical protein NY08_1807 [Rhodococcus sp. B7740]|nr:hypothetical protein NY08_1807 [Rhodococcus sp. B7740]
MNCSFLEYAGRRAPTILQAAQIHSMFGTRDLRSCSAPGVGPDAAEDRRRRSS